MRRYREGGLSIVPIDVRTKRPATPLLPHQADEDGNLLYHHKDADGNRTVTTERSDYPKRGWKVFQTTPADANEVERWIKAGVVSVAVIGGKVSGGVEILDFDVDGYYEKWLARVASKLKVILPTQRTGGGGIQVAWRCENPSGNMKLAWHPGDEPDEWLIAIETRGEAGYAVLPFSLHPSGNTYELLCGDFAEIPTITQALRDELIAEAIKLNQKPEEVRSSYPQSAPLFSQNDGVDQGMTVSEAFNARHRITDMLIRYGYTESGAGRWSRPGKADSGGVLVNLQENKSYHMSSNDPLDSEKSGKRQPRSPFDFFVHFEHGGDWRSATRAAAIELGMAYSQPQSMEAVSL
ncbi:bifunctional DNA primase/polymerase, partial [Candidatus Kaiserbacteria bacterium]|nr:bifunctional DNA primase/polymerase [Candidatus Kaiserbacteria bacterium]